MIKCWVWDLDDTLLCGNASQKDHILNPDMAELVREADRAGLIQSIASRNLPETAQSALEKWEISSFFVYPQFGLGSKIPMLQEILQKLGISASSVLLIDDNEYNRQEAGHFFPEIHTADPADLQALRAMLEEQKKLDFRPADHRALFRLQEQRAEAASQFPGTREEFLASCQTRMTVRAACLEDADRICELVQRTNQFNNVRERMTRDWIEEKTASGWAAVCVLSDRFGDHGMMGVCFLSPLCGPEGGAVSKTGVSIDLFCISCRMEGQGIGTAFLGEVVRSCLEHTPEVRCFYRMTKENRPVLLLLKLLGFSFLSQEEELRVYRRTREEPKEIPRIPWIEVRQDAGMK